MKLKNKIALGLISVFSFQTLGALAYPNTNKNNQFQKLLAVENNNNYELIDTISLNSNGNLKIKFCDKVELLEGKVNIKNINYNVKDAYKITNKKITWRLDKKNTFSKGDKVDVNTISFLGKPYEKEANLKEVLPIKTGCGAIGIPNVVQVKGTGLGIGPIIGLALIIGIGAGTGGSGSGSTSSN